MDCADPAGLMSGCTSVFQIEEPHPTPTPPKGDPQTVQKYTVTKSTGLYELPQVDSQMITELSAGTQLMSAEGNLYLDCRELTDAESAYQVMQNGSCQYRENGLGAGRVV